MELRQRLEAEHAILERIATGAGLRETLDALVLLIERQSEGIVCSILLLDAAAGCLRHGAAPSLPQTYIDLLDGLKIGPTEGSCGAAAFTGEEVVAEDILTNSNWTVYKNLAAPHGLRSCWSTPILSAEKEVLGTFANYRRVPWTPTAEEREWVAIATHLAAIAITRSRTTDAIRRAESHALHISRIYAVASSVSELFVRPRRPEELYDAACRIAVEKGLARLAWIGEYDEEADTLPATTRHGEAAEYAADLTLHLRRPGFETSPAARALSTNTPAISNDLVNDPNFRWDERTRAFGLRSCAVFPIRVAGEKPAIFVIYGATTAFFDAEVVEVLGTLARNIGFAIAVWRAHEERERLFGQLNERVNQMTAVHAVARHLQVDSRLDEEVLAELIEMLRRGLRHPSQCEVRLRWKEIVAQTPKFDETEWRRSKPTGTEGMLEIASREAPPSRDTFALEEGEFLQSLADMFGSHFARVTAERELRRREEQLQLASSVAKVGGWTVDLQTRRLRWSDQLFALHELPIGNSPKLRDALATCAPEFREVAAAAFDACMREGKPFDLVLQMTTASERRIWIRAIGTAERDANGAVIRVHGALQNIDERHQLEDQLRQSQKMEAVGRLAGGIAHDFNNLLSIILSYSAYVLDGLAPGDPMRADLEQIFGAGKRASDLTRQLLTFSRQQASSPRNVNVTQVVAGIEKMLRRLLDKHVTLTIVGESHIGSVFVDRGQLEQVIVNLVVNARDAVGADGKIGIEIAEATLEGARYVMLTVSDDGHGMDEATRIQIFEPFFTTKEKGKGTGLGLATVYGIVKQAGGHVFVSSEPNVGTTFKLYFPLVDAPPDSAPASAEIAPRRIQPQGMETILLVEDSDQIRAIASAVLRRAGYTVLETDSSDSALALGEEHEGRIDLLLTEVALPRSRGRDVAQKLLAKRPDLRVLYISGQSAEAVTQQGMLTADASFLEKPITPDALLKKVRETLRRGSVEESKPQHILHVDDDETLIVLIARILGRLGYKVSAFNDPAEAVEAFAENPDRFQAVVTDVEMPGMTGFDLVRKLRAIRSNIPVVVTSGAFRANDIREAKELELHSLVVKPNTVDELGHALLAELKRTPPGK